MDSPMASLVIRGYTVPQRVTKATPKSRRLLTKKADSLESMESRC